jgi:hypothetical protein
VLRHSPLAPLHVLLVELLLPVQLLVPFDLFHPVHLDLLLHVGHGLHLCPLDDLALVLLLLDLLLKHADLGVED